MASPPAFTSMSLSSFTPALMAFGPLILTAVAYNLNERLAATRLSAIREELEMCSAKLDELLTNYSARYGELPSERTGGRSFDEDLVGFAGDKVASSYGVNAGGMAGYAAMAAYALAKHGAAYLFSRLKQSDDQRNLIAEIAAYEAKIKDLRKSENRITLASISRALAAGAVSFVILYFLLP